MDNKEMNELFYGKDIVEKAELFQAELDAIEQKHIEYFKEREPNHFEKQDQLNNHYIIITEQGRVMFNFTPGSDLDQNIKDECIEAFKKIYPGATQNPK